MYTCDQNGYATALLFITITHSLEVILLRFAVVPGLRNLSVIFYHSVICTNAGICHRDPVISEQHLIMTSPSKPFFKIQSTNK